MPSSYPWPKTPLSSLLLLNPFRTPVPYMSGLFSHSFFLFLNIYLLIYFWLSWVFVAMRAFSSCGEQRLLFIAVRGLLIAVASLVVEHGL